MKGTWRQIWGQPPSPQVRPRKLLPGYTQRFHLKSVLCELL